MNTYLDYIQKIEMNSLINCLFIMKVLSWRLEVKSMNS